MSKLQKKILFISLVFWFLVFSLIFVFYSQGYRFDFSKRKIVQTGGLFLKISPPGVSIYLNDKLIKKTNFLFDSLFLNNLIPGEYKIQIEKDGYHSWSKTLPVEELKVTEAKYIRLFPKKLNFKDLEKNIQDIYLLNNQEIILQRNTNNGWEIVKLNSDLKKEVLARESDFVKYFSNKKNKTSEIFALKLENIIFSSNKAVLLRLTHNKETKLLLFDLVSKEIQELPLKDIKIKEIKFDPKDPEKIYILGKRTEQKKLSFGLFVFQKNQDKVLNITAPAGFEPITFDFLNGDLVWLNKDGFLLRGKIKDRVSLQVIEIFNLKPRKIEEEEYKLKIIKDNIFLFEGEKLFYLDPLRHIFVPVIEVAKNFSLSPDNKKIAISTGHQIWLFYLKDDYQQPKRSFLEKFLLTTSEEAINDILWINPYYLIISYKTGIKIIEIDNRSKLNETIISEFKNPKIFWDPNKKRLFVLSNKTLFFVDKLLK
ncbi:MAG: PEGA domain-containing protein [Candidatus Pacebacteria bacterium]|nr:PEGA domain-containing protein [Candidatus Paceibacterota bacterium]